MTERCPLTNHTRHRCLRRRGHDGECVYRREHLIPCPVCADVHPGPRCEAWPDRCPRRDSKRRCWLEAGHDGDCDYNGVSRRVLGLPWVTDAKRRRISTGPPRRQGEPRRSRACPGCGRVHPGPRCLSPELRRRPVSVSLDLDVLSALDVYVQHARLGPRGRSHVVNRALRDYLRRPLDASDE